MNAMYELVDHGDQWAAVRNGTDVFMTYDRDADPTEPGPYGILTCYTRLVEERWGRTPSWVQVAGGWRAT